LAAKRNKAVNVDFLREDGPEADLSSIFARSVSDTAPITQVALDHLLDNPYQQRAQLDTARLAELADVIKGQGFQGVLVARPHPTRRGFYQLAYGHRRREAAKLAGLTVVPVQVRDFSEEEMAELVITENIQRDDLTLLEEGRTFQLMIDTLRYTQEQVARAVGKTRGYVENRLRVARAPEDVQALVVAKPDSLRAVSALIRVNDPDLRAAAIGELQAGRLTADDLPGYLTSARSSAAEAPANASSQPTTAPPTVADGQPDQAQNGTRGANLPVASTATQEPAAVVVPPAPVGKKKDATLVSTPSEDQDDVAQVRIGYGTLMTAFRALTKYRDRLEGRSEISIREQVVLTDLRNLILDLYEHHDGSGEVDQPDR